MAITVPGSGSSATTSVTIPAHAVGDMIVIMARGTVAPTAPAAGGTVPTWTTPTNQTGVNNSVGWRLGYAVATATNHTSGTWTNAAQMHVLVLHPSAGTLGIGNDPAQGGANNTQTMIYPAWTHTAGKLANLVIRYGARGTADTEVRTDGAFAASGVWHTEQPATTPTSAVFSKVVVASEGTFTATPAGVNAAYRCGTLEITETAAPTVYSKAADITLTPAIASVATFFSVFEAAASVALTPAVASSGHKIVERSASITLTPDVASDGESETPSTYSPTDVTGLYAWWKADAIAQSDNTTVASWADSSGNGHAAASATGQTFQTNELNGLPGVQFDGTDDILTAGSWAADSTRTVIIVAKATAATATRTLWGLSTSARVQINGPGTWGWQLNQAAGNTDLGGTATNSSMITVAWSSGSVANGYMDAGSATFFDPNSAITTAATMYLGSHGGGGSFFPGFVYECIVYDSELSAADRQLVHYYLDQKYALGLGVPEPSATVYERSASITITPAVASAGHEGTLPTDIAGLYAWYDADQLGLANNDPVTSWTDESGGGRHATSATGPAYKTAVQNGLPGVLFDGTDDRLNATIAADASRTIFIVAKQTSAVAKTLLGTGNSSARLNTGVTTGWGWLNIQGGAGITFGAGTEPTTNATVISLVVASTSSMTAYINDDAGTSFDPNDVVTTVTTLALGTNAPTSNFFNGYIFEVVAYDTALGTTDRESVRDYLTDKWIPAVTVHESSASVTITPDVASIPGTYVGQVTADSPLAWWRLGESSTGTAQEVNNVYDGTYVTGGVFAQTGAVGDSDTAVRFDGVDDYATLTTIGSLGTNIATSTCEFWIKTTTTSLAAVLGTRDTGTDMLFEVQLNTRDSAATVAGSTNISIRAAGGAAVHRNYITTNIYDGNWHHIVIVMQSTTVLPKWWVDGVERTATQVATGTLVTRNNFDNPMALAARNNVGTIERYAAATVDEVAFYTTQLTEARIQAHYDAAAPAAPTVYERSASITITPAVTSVRQTVHLRSASVTLTPAVASQATFFSILARSAAVAITPAIATAPQRVLMRATAVTITPAIVSAGQIEGGLVEHERSASVTLTPAVASSATFYSIVERSASVEITPAIASAQMRVVMRQASVTLTPAVASSGAILQIWSRAASVTITTTISAAGFGGTIFETHLPLTVEIRDALLTVVHDEGETSILFDSSESTVIYDETTTDVAIEGDRDAAVPEHSTSVDVAEPVLTVDYEETPRTVEVV